MLGIVWNPWFDRKATRERKEEKDEYRNHAIDMKYPIPKYLSTVIAVRIQEDMSHAK